MTTRDVRLTLSQLEELERVTRAAKRAAKKRADGYRTRREAGATVQHGSWDRAIDTLEELTEIHRVIEHNLNAARRQHKERVRGLLDLPTERV